MRALEESTAHPCRIDPDTALEARWSRPQGAGAYVAQTVPEDFSTGLAARGVHVPVEYLYLLGISASAAGTTIVFPSQFGVIERLSVDRDDKRRSPQTG